MASRIKTAPVFLRSALAASPQRWLAALFFVLVSWLVVGGVVSFMLMEHWQTTLLTGEPTLFFVAVHAGFVLFAAAILCAQSLFLSAPLGTLFVCERSFLWTRLLHTFVLWLALMTVASALEAFLFPGRIYWRGWVADWPRWLLLIALLTPIQVVAEELFFRCLLPRLCWRLGASPLLAIVLAAAAFTGVHLPLLAAAQGWELLTFYFCFGLFSGALVLSEQGLERVIGWHLAQNLFAFWGVSHGEQSLRTPALFHTSSLEPCWSLLQFLLLSLFGYVILMGFSLKGKVS